MANEDGVAEKPIIGYNVIENLLEKGVEPRDLVREAVSAAFSFDCKKTEVFLKLKKDRDDKLRESMVKVGMEFMTIPAGQKKTAKCSVRTSPSCYPVEWSDEHQQVLCLLVDFLSQPPGLRYPDFEQPFIVHLTIQLGNMMATDLHYSAFSCHILLA